jgi:hypothetical protein
MANPTDGPGAKGRGSLVALTAVALSASIALPAVASAQQGTSYAQPTNTAHVKKPSCADGGICVPAKKRRSGVGIPGRPYK